jgi:hypothetical protein
MTGLSEPFRGKMHRWLHLQLGLDNWRDPLQPEDFLPHTFARPIEVRAAVQTILGTILLFLFGLGIRNKFRMK